MAGFVGFTEEVLEAPSWGLWDPNFQEGEEKEDEVTGGETHLDDSTGQLDFTTYWRIRGVGQNQMKFRGYLWVWGPESRDVGEN